MSMEELSTETGDLSLKIKRLVEERGWNQEEFARIARLNRHTARQILIPGGQRRMRNATISACARALGLTVSELRIQPLEKLLPRMVEGAVNGPDDALRRMYDQATQPELRAWMERNPDRARLLSEEERDELLSLQGPEGPLTAFGVDAFVQRIERRRKLVQQVHAIAGTEYLDLLEQFVGLLHEKVQPGATALDHPPVSPPRQIVLTVPAGRVRWEYVHNAPPCRLVARGPAVSPRRWRLDTFRALRHRNYRLYFFGQIVSLTGSWVQTAALMWLAWELTHQSRWAGLVSAAQVVPTVLLGVYGGGLADRWPRRPLIFATQFAFLVLALLLTGMVVLDVATPWALIVVSLFIGIVNAVDTPARLAFVCDMVGREDLMNAVALNSLVFNVARAVGPALSSVVFIVAVDAGWVLGLGTLPWLGAAACFLFNALTFVAVLIALLAMHLPPRPVVVLEKRVTASMAEAFRHLAERRGLVLLVVLAGAMAFFGWPLLSLLPALADEQLHAGKAGYDEMLSAVGAAALVAALLVASFGTVARRILFLGAGVVVEIVSLVGLIAAHSLLVAVACCTLSGAGLILFFATGQAMMQLGAGEHNRGRIMGIWLMVLSAAHPVGHLLAGAVADAWGVSLVVGLQGAGIAAAAAVVGMAALAERRRQLRSLAVAEAAGTENACVSPPGEGSGHRTEIRGIEAMKTTAGELGLVGGGPDGGDEGSPLSSPP